MMPPFMPLIYAGIRGEAIGVTLQTESAYLISLADQPVAQYQVDVANRPFRASFANASSPGSARWRRGCPADSFSSNRVDETPDVFPECLVLLGDFHFDTAADRPRGGP